MNIFSKEELEEIFEYRDGELYYKQPVSASICNGYKRICVNGKMVPLHRVIFALHKGYLPEIVDHIDGNKLNNKIENLRPADTYQNKWNTPSRKNTSGVKNVSWHKQRNSWQVRISGKSYGLYKTIEEAEKVAIEMRNKLHGEYANHNVI